MKKTITFALGFAMTMAAVQPSVSYANVLRNPAGNMYDTLARWNLQGDASLIKGKFFGDRLGLRGGYQYKVEPSYTEGLFTRFDNYYFNTSVDSNPNQVELLDAKDRDFSAGLGLRHEMEVSFARQFADSEDAIKAKPYFYKNIPLNADDAINNLNEGDYVSMKTHLSLVVGGEFLQALGHVNVGLSVSAQYLVRGEFQVSALRLPNNQLRLKLVGLRNKEKSVGIGIGYDGVLEIVKVSYIDRKLTKALDLNPLEITYNDGKNNLFMVDYVVDLNDAEVKKAYAGIMRKMTDLETSKVLDPRKSDDNVKNMLLMDIQPLDQLAISDRSKDKKRAQRSFKGSLEQEYEQWQSRFGIAMIRLQENRDYSENRLVSVNLDEGRSHFLINSYQARTEGNLLFAWSKIRKDVRFNAIFATDEAFQNAQADDLVFSIETKDRKFTKSELATLRKTISRTVTPDLSSLIDWAKWSSADKWDANTAIRYQVVLHPEAIDAAPQLSEAQITEKYLDYLQNDIDAGDMARSYAPRGTVLTGYDDGREAFKVAFGRGVSQIARQLAITLNKNENSVKRIDALMELRKSRLFKETGIRFLLSLLPKEGLEKLIRFDFAMESTNGNRLSASFGDEKESEVYQRMLYIQSILNNDGLDLRLEGETIKMNVLGAGQKK